MVENQARRRGEGRSADAEDSDEGDGKYSKKTQQAWQPQELILGVAITGFLLLITAYMLNVTPQNAPSQPNQPQRQQQQQQQQQQIALDVASQPAAVPQANASAVTRDHFPNSAKVQQVLAASWDIPKPAQQPAKPKEVVLLSEDKPATSDVRGNLGLAQVVTNSNIDDWMTDRWQAASDMNGSPIPGPHWIEIDLEKPAVVKQVLVDWESAYSEDYSITGRLRVEDRFEEMAASRKVKMDTETMEQHNIHEFEIPGDWLVRHESLPRVELKQHGCTAPPESVRYIRLEIEKGATAWGSSVWRFQLFGYFIDECNEAKTA